MKNVVNTSVQKPIIINEIAEKFRGKWVAVEHGRVIASAASMRELYDRVPLDAMAMHVPGAPRV
ncbi:DUF5678 domain-containing protein [Patulibacter sp. NPDC049589]|uniref:DUF5678 domain-containing protein n=1 Tax=Patulibacter sp. NPDC049589 TaxID=3154731 RepID=UPI00342E60BB